MDGVEFDKEVLNLPSDRTIHEQQENNDRDQNSERDLIRPGSTDGIPVNYDALSGTSPEISTMNDVPVIPSSQSPVSLSITFKGQSQRFSVDPQTSFETFQNLVQQSTNILAENQKFMVPKAGMIRAESITNPKDTFIIDVFKTEQMRSHILLIGTPSEDLQRLQHAEEVKANEFEKLRNRNRNLQKYRKMASSSSLSSSRPTAPVVDSSELSYTFHRLVPLPFLPHPERSLEMLERLRDDRGIRAIMTKYKWSVGVLTELDPASNTSHSSRLLGLNRNRGEIIELRLRTDDYGGYCSYKEVRKVLCHELTHNIHGDHDSKFWDLCKTLERQVVELDPFGSGGRGLSSNDYYEGPGLGVVDEDEDSHELYDEGGWFGGTFEVGGKASDEDIRVLMRKAAEERRNNK